MAVLERQSVPARDIAPTGQTVWERLLESTGIPHSEIVRLWQHMDDPGELGPSGHPIERIYDQERTGGILQTRPPLLELFSDFDNLPLPIQYHALYTAAHEIEEFRDSVGFFVYRLCFAYEGSDPSGIGKEINTQLAQGGSKIDPKTVDIFVENYMNGDINLQWLKQVEADDSVRWGPGVRQKQTRLAGWVNKLKANYHSMIWSKTATRADELFSQIRSGAEEGKTDEEIARNSGLPLETVRTVLYYAIVQRQLSPWPHHLKLFENEIVQSLRTEDLGRLAAAMLHYFNLTYPEIEKAVDTKQDNARLVIFRKRRKTDKKLSALGFILASRLPQYVERAVESGECKGRQFLNRWYTTEKAVDSYHHPEREPHLTLQEIFKRLHQEVLDSISRPSLKTAVAMKLSGRNDSEIAWEQEVSKETIESYLSEARSLYESVLSSHGIKPLASYNDKGLYNALKRKQLEAEYFVGHLYTTDRAVDKFRKIVLQTQQQRKAQRERQVEEIIPYVFILLVRGLSKRAMSEELGRPTGHIESAIGILVEKRIIKKRAIGRPKEPLVVFSSLS